MLILESLNEVKELVEKGNYLTSSAVKAKGVPKETLRRWLHKTPGKQDSGWKPVLTKEEEELIIVALKKCSALAWPVRSEEITLMVKSYLDNCDRKEERFKNNPPGEDWLISFKRRWQDWVRLRKPEVLTKARAKFLNEETLTSFSTCILMSWMKMGFLMMIQLSKFSMLMRQDVLLIQTNADCSLKNLPRTAVCSLQHVGKPCTQCLYVALLLVNICHFFLCIRDNICLGHGVRMD